MNGVYGISLEYRTPSMNWPKPWRRPWRLRVFSCLSHGTEYRMDIYADTMQEALDMAAYRGIKDTDIADMTPPGLRGPLEAISCPTR